MLVLDAGSYDTFANLLSPKGTAFLNTASSTDHPHIDATDLAAKMGSPLMSNLVLLGFALGYDRLFCKYFQVEETAGKISPPRFKEAGLGSGMNFEKSRQTARPKPDQTTSGITNSLPGFS